MNKNEMLLEMIDYYTNGNKRQFAKRLGVPANTISTWLARNTFNTELIFSKCQDISPVWLLTGEGDMIAKRAEALPSGNIDYAKVTHLCQVLVENYQQRDHIISELIKLLTK